MACVPVDNRDTFPIKLIESQACRGACFGDDDERVPVIGPGKEQVILSQVGNIDSTQDIGIAIPDPVNADVPVLFGLYLEIQAGTLADAPEVIQ